MTKKRLSTIMAMALSASLFLGSTNSSAVFNAGENSKSFSYAGKSGSVSAMADVTGDSSGNHYKYKGDIYYSAEDKLTIYVIGYYSSNGSTRPVTNEKTVTGKKTATTYAYVPDGAKGVCTASKQCTATGSVKSTAVKSVNFPG